MKTIVCALMMSVAALAATNEAPTMTEQEQMFMEAVMLKQQGFYVEAEVRLKRLAELQPDQPTIKQMLTEVQQKLRQKAADPATVLKRKLSATIIPEINFRDARLDDVVRFLGDESLKFSPDRTAVNIVRLAPEEAKSTKVTLQLRKIPLLDVLQYVTDVAKLKFRIDGHAVVIYKPEQPPAAEPNAKP